MAPAGARDFRPSPGSSPKVLRLEIFEGALRLLRPYFVPTTVRDFMYATDETDASAEVVDLIERRRLTDDSYTIFEGTSEIQPLVVARSVSGLHIP